MKHIIEVTQIYKDVSGNKNLQIPSMQSEVKRHLILQLYVPIAREITDNWSCNGVLTEVMFTRLSLCLLSDQISSRRTENVNRSSDFWMWTLGWKVSTEMRLRQFWAFCCRAGFRSAGLRNPNMKSCFMSKWDLTTISSSSGLSVYGYRSDL